ncbi:hypothetical protein PC129_g24974 [Phytophthora cactorum]|uniref:Uncharacterized protein n=1 Tax=Phytophthora cactorum TaxID=29920 RepID=A0A8T1GQP9_9STRA|nr:hypothetical protein PC129_g24974 [Phytophthora cactorum]
MGQISGHGLLSTPSRRAQLEALCKMWHRDAPGCGLTDAVTHG